MWWVCGGYGIGDGFVWWVCGGYGIGVGFLVGGCSMGARFLVDGWVCGWVVIWNFFWDGEFMAMSCGSWFCW